LPSSQESCAPSVAEVRQDSPQLIPISDCSRYGTHACQLVEKVREVQRRRTLLAIAARILVAVGIAGRVLVGRHNETVVPQAAVIDLRNRSVSRSPEPNLGGQPLELRRGFSLLNIYLPLGSPEGAYEVRIVTTSGDSLLNAGGTASLNDGVTILLVSGNLSLARPGQCIMQIRKPPFEWRFYPFVLR